MRTSGLHSRAQLCAPFSTGSQEPAKLRNSFVAAGNSNLDPGCEVGVGVLLSLVILEIIFL